jgi:hypothetical protein
MTLLIIFALSYTLGGLSALLIIGLAIAARRGDRGDAISGPHMPAEEAVAAWHTES